MLYLRWIGLAMAVLLISGCGLSQMPQLIEENEKAIKASSASIRENQQVVTESTDAIRRNQVIVERSSRAIALNAAVIRDSTATIAQNQQALERLSPTMEKMQAMVPTGGGFVLATTISVGVVVLFVAALVATAIAALRISAAVRRMERKG